PHSTPGPLNQTLSGVSTRTISTVSTIPMMMSLSFFNAIFHRRDSLLSVDFRSRVRSLFFLMLFDRLP
ncbi:MAG: hypothetical protein OXG18_08690, partial [Gemmatimonadetes bacterium]|nr:hypothetical protein [Gemmatimonadota bacterium]